MTETVDTPLVSIALLTYNNEDEIEGAIEQFLAQDYPKLEIVICDDCSSDKTVEICRPYVRGKPPVQLYVNERNLGSWYNFAYALSLVRGKYVMWPIPGDLWDPSLVSKLVQRLIASPGATACGGEVDMIDGRTRQVIRHYDFRGRRTPTRFGPARLAMDVIFKARDYQQKDRIAYGATFMQGLLDAAKVKAALAAFRGCGPVMNERQVLCQLALAGSFVHVDETLSAKIVGKKSALERGPYDPSRISSSKRRFYYARAAGKLIWSLSRSRIVPWRRKLFIPIIVGTYLARDFAHIAFIWSVAVLRAVLPERLYHALRNTYRKRRPA